MMAYEPYVPEDEEKELSDLRKAHEPSTGDGLVAIAASIAQLAKALQKMADTDARRREMGR